LRRENSCRHQSILINTWLQPGASIVRREPFQRLFWPEETVQTVFVSARHHTGLKPGVNENGILCEH
jgi:hypothetical protein